MKNKRRKCKRDEEEINEIAKEKFFRDKEMIKEDEEGEDIEA